MTSGFPHILSHPIVCHKYFALPKLEGSSPPRWLHFPGVFSQLISFFGILLKAECDSYLRHSCHRCVHRSRLEAPPKTSGSCRSRSLAADCCLSKRDRSPGLSGLIRFFQMNSLHSMVLSQETKQDANLGNLR